MVSPTSPNSSSAGPDSTGPDGPGGAGPDGTGVDWSALREAAVEAMRRAYAPYSGFPVGAAALVDDGRIVAGCNVENVSYGLGLCAECAVVCALHSTGGGRLRALACVDGRGTLLMPCGRSVRYCWNTAARSCSSTIPRRPGGSATCCPTPSVRRISPPIRGAVRE